MKKDRKPIVIEGESLVDSARASGGGVINVQPWAAWSGGKQLIWPRTQKGDTLRFSIKPPQSGRYDLVLKLVHALDYATVRVSPGKLEPKDIELVGSKMDAIPYTWENVTLSSLQQFDIKIEILSPGRSGHCGIDCIELVPR